MEVELHQDEREPLEGGSSVLRRAVVAKTKKVAVFRLRWKAGAAEMSGPTWKGMAFGSRSGRHGVPKAYVEESLLMVIFGSREGLFKN